MAYRYGRSELVLYVDGEATVLTGVKQATRMFYLAGTPDEPAAEGDYRNCTLHYAALSQGMIQNNFKTGRISYSSLALFAPLDDLWVAPSLRLINLAPTELRMQVQSGAPIH